jgi:hypothetical protein
MLFEETLTVFWTAGQKQDKVWSLLLHHTSNALQKINATLFTMINNVFFRSAVDTKKNVRELSTMLFMSTYFFARFSPT